MAHNTWTAEEEKILVEGLKKGMKMGEIADMLPGRTRNAVIGMANRMRDPTGLHARKGRTILPPLAPNPNKSENSRTRRMREAREKTALLRKAAEEAAIAAANKEKARLEEANRLYKGPVGLFDLTANCCRFMVTDELYCGRVTEVYGSPYCDEHRKLVYTKIPSRRTTDSNRPFQLGRKRSRYA